MAQPTTLQLQLALAIVRSKPADCTVREYIDSFRRHIVNEKPSSPSIRYRLDNNSLWHEAYQRIGGLNSKLEDDNHRLRQENERLQNLLDNADTTRTTKRLSVKRKANVGPALPTAGPLKRTKITALTGKTHSNEALTLEGCPEDRRTMRHLQQLFKVYGEDKPDSQVLASELKKTATSLSSIMVSSIKAQGADTLSETSRSAARVFVALLHGLDLLDKLADDHGLCGSVVYHLVAIFEGAMTALQENVLLFGESCDAMTTIRDTPSSKARTTSNFDEKKLEAVSHFTLSLFTSLDPARDVHNEVFEGFLFVLLNHLGLTLHNFTFHHDRQEDIDLDMRQVSQAAETSDEPGTRAARVFAPHLLAIFKQAMRLAPAHLSSTTGEAAQAAHGSLSVPRSSMLSKIAQDRLQRTLIKCTFGTEHSSKDAFIDCLRMPDIPEPATETARSDTRQGNARQDVGEWFTEELWSLLGWDLLSRDENFLRP